jgi:hypothetical protein
MAVTFFIFEDIDIDPGGPGNVRYVSYGPETLIKLQPDNIPLGQTNC